MVELVGCCFGMVVCEEKMREVVCVVVWDFFVGVSLFLCGPSKFKRSLTTSFSHSSTTFHGRLEPRQTRALLYFSSSPSQHQAFKQSTVDHHRDTQTRRSVGLTYLRRHRSQVPNTYADIPPSLQTKSNDLAQRIRHSTGVQQFSTVPCCVRILLGLSPS